MAAKLTAAQKAANKAARKAKQMNAHQARRFGPLFAHLAPTVTPAQAAEHQRVERVKGVEFAHATASAAARGLEWLAVWAARDAAARLVGPAAADRLLARAVEVYQEKPTYVLGFLRRALTTAEPLALAYERRTDPAKANRYNPDGGYVVVAEGWPAAGYVPPLSAAAFDALTGLPELPANDDDPAGLFDRVMAALPRKE